MVIWLLLYPCSFLLRGGFCLKEDDCFSQAVIALVLLYSGGCPDTDVLCALQSTEGNRWKNQIYNHTTLCEETKKAYCCTYL